MTRLFSTSGRVALLVSLLMALVALAGAFASRALEPWWLGWTVALLVALPLLWLGVDRILAEDRRLIRAVRDGIDSLRDSDFSVSIADKGNPDLARLISAHNELGDALRTERQTLYQRELLLDTVIQTTDLALVLVNAGGAIVYSNAAARQLFRSGRPINGFDFEVLLTEMPGAFAEAVDAQRPGLFTVETDNPETWHLSSDAFTLNAQPHRLFLFKQLTQELSRQEVATWKKVIRLISHELNNSLAPISSLAHSGKTLLARSGHDEQLDRIFTTIEDRSGHLKDFIGSYAQFARLPAPRPQAVDWPAFLETLRDTVPFELNGEVPSLDCKVDPAQFEQVLINLLKNAYESGSPADAVRLGVERNGTETVFTVSDRGGGVSDDVLQSALLPFYSTKKTGTGLGLPLCREIIEAHGGRLSLTNTGSRDAGDAGLKVRISLPG